MQVVGWVWTATGTHFEGLISTSKGVSFADLAAAPNPILAAAKVPGAGIWQMIFAIGALEVRRRAPIGVVLLLRGGAQSCNLCKYRSCVP